MHIRSSAIWLQETSFQACAHPADSPAQQSVLLMQLLVQVCKVYIGSFNADKPIRTDMNPSGEELFNKEQSDLLQDLFEIPQRSCDRKVHP